MPNDNPVKKLSITADDYGAHPLIDAAIEECVDAGNVDNVDCFVTVREQDLSDDRAYSSARAISGFVAKYHDRLADGSLSLGLHFSLTCGKTCSQPAAAVKHLLCDENDMFWNNAYVKFRELSQNPDVIRNELDAQHLEFIAAAGFVPHHLSCHSGIAHLNPIMAWVYFTWAVDKEMIVRNPFLVSSLSTGGDNPTVPNNNLRWNTEMKRIALKNIARMLTSDPLLNEFWAVYALNKRTAYDNLVAWNVLPLMKDYFIDNFYCDARFSNLKRIIENLHPGYSEMVVHPVHTDSVRYGTGFPNGIALEELEERQGEFITMSTPRIIDSVVAAKLGQGPLETRFRLRKIHKAKH